MSGLTSCIASILNLSEEKIAKMIELLRIRNCKNPNDFALKIESTFAILIFNVSQS